MDILGISSSFKLKETPVAEELRPKDAVRRIIAAAGVDIPDKEAYWLGFHMERFVKHAREHGELLDLPDCVEAYRSFCRSGGMADWQFAQLDQALMIFARGTERF